MITYTYPYPEHAPTLKVPKLHRVNYNHKYNEGEVRWWCTRNCRGPFYTSMMYKRPFYTSPERNGKFIEFEDDEDAVVFALKFS